MCHEDFNAAEPSGKTKTAGRDQLNMVRPAVINMCYPCNLMPDPPYFAYSTARVSRTTVTRI